MSIINCTVRFDLRASADDSADGGLDADNIALIGDAYFTPQFRDDRPLLANDYSPRPTGFMVRQFKGTIDSSGRLGGSDGVRIWANDPVFNLERLVYRITWDVRTPLGEPVTIEPSYFEAPSTDTDVQLAAVLSPTGWDVRGTLRSQGYAEDIIDSGAFGRELVRAQDSADAFTSLGVSETGAAVLTATDQGQARKALGLPVFDARDYGVVADGTANNNVANLLDCVADCVSAGGGTVLLPAGIIVTSDAVMYATVTANSGNTYTNNGGIPIPVDCPITIVGHGVGVTTLRLSPGFLRAFDMWYEADGQLYRDITIADMTIDRHDVSSTTIASGTASGSVTINASTWTTIPGLAASGFRNAKHLYFPGTNSGTAKRVYLPCKVVGSAVKVQGVGWTNLTVSAGDTVTGCVNDHVIVGMTQNGHTDEGTGAGFSGESNAPAMSVDNLTIRNVDAVNIPMLPPTDYYDDGGGLQGWVTDRSWGISLRSIGGTGTLTNITIDHVRIFGGDFGVVITGGAGTFIDNVKVTDCFHDTLADQPTRFSGGANFMFGGNAWLGRVWLERCTGRRSTDVGVEFDQPWEAWEIDCVWEEAFSAIMSGVFAVPAATADGPPSVTLSAGINNSATTASLAAAVPDSVARSGFAKIGDEFVWYQTANTAGTSLTLSRGVSGSTAASHSTGAALEFVEVDKTRIHSIRSTIRNTADSMDPNPAWPNTAYPAGKSGYPGSVAYLAGAPGFFYPLTPLIVRDAIVDISGGEPSWRSRFFYTVGYRPLTEINNSEFRWSGFDNATGGGGGFGVTWYDAATASDYARSVPIPPAQFRGRNNRFKVDGTYSNSAAASFLLFYGSGGYLLFDLEFAADLQLTATTGTLDAVVVELSTFGSTPNVIAPGSRLGITAANKAVTNAYALKVGGDNWSQIVEGLQVDLDASGMKFTTDSTDSHYQPWSLETDKLGKVHFNRVVHSTAAVGKYPARKRPTVKVSATESPYAVTASDEIILVDSSAGAVTITLPPSTGGGAYLGEPLTRGRQVQVIDAGFAAATHAITITPAASDKIDGGTAGASTTITANGGRKVLTAYESMPGWVSDRVQPVSTDLTAIAALSPSDDDVLQRKSGAWTNRTIAQVKTDLGLPAITRAVSTITAGTTLSAADSKDYVIFVNVTPSAAVLLHGDGANNSTTFLDSSVSASNFTGAGNAKISTTQSKFGGSSIYLDGSSYITATTSPSNIAFGTGPYTVEFWIYGSNFTTYQTVLDFTQYQASIGTTALITVADGTFKWRSAADRITSGTVSTGQWHHIAICRSDVNTTTTKMFVDGVQSGSTWTGDNLNYACGASRPVIGADGWDLTAKFTGYIDDLRISKSAKYTANFTVPSAAHADDVVTLPTAVGNSNQYTVKNIHASAAASIIGTSGQTIDGAASYSLAAAGAVRLVSDGSNWRTV